MCDKYCITENELYSLVEWFIIQKMLIKTEATAKAHKNVQTYVCMELQNPKRGTLMKQPRSLRLLWRARYQRLSVFKELGIIFQNRNMYLSGCQQEVLM